MGEHKFYVGDKVKVLQDEGKNTEYIGRIGTIKEKSIVPFVEFDDASRQCFLQEWLELVPQKPAVTPKSLLHINDLVLTAEGKWYIYTNFKTVDGEEVIGLASHDANDGWWEYEDYNDNLENTAEDCQEANIMKIARVDNFLDIIEGISSGEPPTQWEGFKVVWQRLTRESAEEQMKTLEQTIDSTQDSIRELEKQLVSKRQELKAIKEATENL